MRSRKARRIACSRKQGGISQLFGAERRAVADDIESSTDAVFRFGVRAAGRRRRTSRGRGESGQPEGPKFGRPAALPISLAHAYEDSAPACRQPADSRRVHGKYLPLADRRSRAAQQDRGSGAGLRRRQLRGFGRGARQSDLSARRQGSPRSRVPRSRPQRPPGDAAPGSTRPEFTCGESSTATARESRPTAASARAARSPTGKSPGAAPSSTTPAAGGTWPIHGAAGPRSTIARWRRSRRAPRG